MILALLVTWGGAAVCIIIALKKQTKNKSKNLKD